MARLTAADTGSYDQFGWSVAMDGDTVVVGAANKVFSTVTDTAPTGAEGTKTRNKNEIPGVSVFAFYVFLFLFLHHFLNRDPLLTRLAPIES